MRLNDPELEYRGYTRLVGYNYERYKMGNNSVNMKEPHNFPKCNLTNFGLLVWKDLNILTQPKLTQGWKAFTLDDWKSVRPLIDFLTERCPLNMGNVIGPMIEKWGSEPRKY